MRILATLLLWLCLLSSVFATPATVRLDAPSGSIPLGPQVQYLLGHAEQSFEQIAGSAFAAAWQDNAQPVLFLNVQHQGAWLRIDLRQAGAAERLWYLALKWPVIDSAELRLYYPDGGRWGRAFRAGDGIPAATRVVPSRNLVFPLELAANERAIVYLHVRAFEPMALPLELLDASQLQAQELRESILISLLIGTLLVMLLYNSCLYAFTRDRSYGFYVLYLGAVLVYALALTGFAQLYLDLARPWLEARLYPLGAGLSFLMAALFFRDFLKLGQIGGWVDWLNRGTIGYWLLILVPLAVEPYNPVVHWLDPTLGAVLTVLIGLLSSLDLWRRGHRQARVFSIAFGLPLAATILIGLAFSGKLPFNAFIVNSQLIAFAIEFVLLAIALVEHINQERGRLLSAQQAALDYSERLAREREEKLHAQQQALRIQRKANEELEQRVQERTQELKEANFQLARLSTLDALTQLANRRHFEARFAEELNRAKRHASPLALVMLDIDHFKAVNDGYGHPFGDHCLRAVAEVLQAHCQRAGDLAARYGGEEFILVFADTDQAGALHCAEAIRADIAALRLQHGEREVRISASLGVIAGVPPLSERGERLIAEADAALYRAKDAGRNRVVLAGEALLAD